MYFALGWPKTLFGASVDVGPIIRLRRHPLKHLVFALTPEAVLVWHARLHVLVGCFKQPQMKEEQRSYTDFVVRDDGGGVAISAGQGLLFIVEMTYKTVHNVHSSPYCGQHQASVVCALDPEQLRCGCEVSGVTFELTVQKQIPGGVCSLNSFHGNLIVSGSNGKLYLFNWLGVCDQVGGALPVSALKMANDLLPHSTEASPQFPHSVLHHEAPLLQDHLSTETSPNPVYLRPLSPLVAHPLGDDEVVIHRIADCPKLNALVVLFSDRKPACFVPVSSSNFSLTSLVGVWIPEIVNGTQVAVNGKFRLVAVGRANGMVDIFSLEEATGAWFHSHSLQITTDLFPEGQSSLGPVTALEWSHTDAMVLAVAWGRGGLALWTVYGSLLSFSLGPDRDTTPSHSKDRRTCLQTLCWSQDGYSLWMSPRMSPSNHGEDPDSIRGAVVYVQNFLKSAIINNPAVSNHDHILLQGPDRLHLQIIKSMVANGNVGGAQEIGPVMASTPHWMVLQVPESYLSLNWPISYSCVDQDGRYLAVAGKAGVALFSSLNRKWKLFSNEQQEQSVVCRGGLAWWKDIVIFPCVVSYSNVEVRFYSLHSKLDSSQLLYTLKLLSPIAKLNLHGNFLLLLTTNFTLVVFHLSRTVTPGTKATTLHIAKYYETSLREVLPHISMVVSVMTSSLRAEPRRCLPNERGGDEGEEVESILINISGRLIMLQRDFTMVTEAGRKKVSFGAPVCLSSQVELVWAPPPDTPKQRLSCLTQSLWLHSGSQGIKVWLPLFPHDNPHPTFLSKRIMLTLPANNLYPLVVLFQDAVVQGLTQETMFFGGPLSPSSVHTLAFPYSTVEKSVQLCLHPILRQLLKRNLGSHALQMAQACCHLPYFAHILECMLHEVLEEEAPGKLPIPDPLLPQVVQFIKQFPQFHETVSSCARKTEVALWHYLFAAVGRPRELFEACMSSGNLATAATYLIIIQNLETSAVSRQLATRLLEAALDGGMWSLSQNLIRYLQAIGSGEIAMATPKIVTPNTPFGVGGTLSSEHVGTKGSVEGSSPGNDEGAKVFQRPQFVADASSKVEYFVELLLSRHSRKLLASSQLRELGQFAAHLEFNLTTWFAKERTRAAQIDNFVVTLLCLHRQFQWPLPVRGRNSRSIPPLQSKFGHITGSLPIGSCRPVLCEDASGQFDRKAFSESPTTRQSEAGSSPSLSRTSRPPDLDLRGMSHVEPSEGTHPSEGSSPGEVTEVTLKKVDQSPHRTEPLWHHQSNSSGSDLDQLASATGTSSLRDAPWLLSLPTRPPEQSDKEVRYLLNIVLGALCLDWCVMLAVLLQDREVLKEIEGKAVEYCRATAEQGGASAVSHLVTLLDDFQHWALEQCPGYQDIAKQLRTLQQTLIDPCGTPPENELVKNLEPDLEQPTVGESHVLTANYTEHEVHSNSQTQGSETQNEPESETCIIS